MAHGRGRVGDSIGAGDCGQGRTPLTTVGHMNRFAVSGVAPGPVHLTGERCRATRHLTTILGAKPPSGLHAEHDPPHMYQHTDARPHPPVLARSRQAAESC